MAVKYYDKATFVDVSYFDEDNFWAGNANIYVQEGTSLPRDAVDVIYTPSAKGKVGVYDPKQKKWTEHDTQYGTEYWGHRGEKFIHESHLYPVPSHAILEKPPVVKAGHVIYRDVCENKWVTHEDRTGKTVYSNYGDCRVVNGPYYSLPEHETFDPKPTRKAARGKQWHIVDSKWVEEDYYHDVPVYDKATGNSKKLHHHYGELPKTHTFKEFKEHHKWDDKKDDWVLDKAAKKAMDDLLESDWIRSEIANIKDELLDHYIAVTFSGSTNVQKPDNVYNYYQELLKYKNSGKLDATKRPVRN